MSKITFRADDDLIRQLEEFDASKSEVMREALREYLDEAEGGSATSEAAEESLDELVADRVDALIAERLDRSFAGGGQQDINVNISLTRDSVASTGATADEPVPTEDASDETTDSVSHEERERKTGDDAEELDRKTCGQCGEDLGSQHVYCPNCGEKAARRVFCECGDELRSDWSFCPGCGRRTPAADVLEGS